MNELTCLLFSPLPPREPDNGDASFTRDLLAHPPPGVTYIPYGEALESGAIEDGPSLRLGAKLPRTPGDLTAAGQRLGLHALRRAGWLLPDPVRWLRLRAHFDVIHIHSMPVRFLGTVPPAVVTDSGGSFWWWTAARGMPLDKVQRRLRRERRLSRGLHYIHPTATPDAASAAFVMVPSARPLFAGLGIDAEAIRALPGGVPEPLALGRRRRGGGPLTLVFVARLFELKGGPEALGIFRRARARVGDVRLVVAGPSDPDPGLEGVTWLGPVSREQLYREVYPGADLMIYPTTFDAGPRVVEEALAHGIPVVAPAAFGLADQVVDGRTGILYPLGDTDFAVDAVVGLLQDRSRLGRMSADAADDFTCRLSADLRNQLLLEAYEAAAARVPL